MTTPRSRAVSRFVLVAVATPVVAAAVGVLLQLATAAALPDPIAIHWGATGMPDGFGPAWVTLLLTVVLGLGMPLIIGGSGLAGLRRGDRGPAYRLMGALAPAMSVFLSALTTASVLIQSGLTDAADGPSIFPWLLAAGVLAVIVGIAAWLVQPDERSEPDRATAAIDPPLAAGERAVWLRRVRLSRGGVIVLAAALLLLVVVAAITMTASGSGTASTLLVVLIVLLVATIAASSMFHVRVDAAGLSVTSVMGFPRVRIPVAQIADVEVVEVSPMGEFGGWGLRWAPGGGFGVVMRKGPAIRVRRTNGTVFTVTVDDAETGAALLTAETERARGR